MTKRRFGIMMIAGLLGVIVTAILDTPGVWFYLSCLFYGFLLFIYLSIVFNLMFGKNWVDEK